MFDLVSNLQNEDLTSIGVKLAQHLARDAAIDEYCGAHFSRPLQIVVGPQEGMEMPSVEDAPYIFVHGLAKSEGAFNKKPVYQCVFCCGVSVDAEENWRTEEGVLVLGGQKKASELMTLVQDALYRYGNDEGCSPPSEIEQIIPGVVLNNARHWEGFLTAVWEFELPMGMRLEF